MIKNILLTCSLLVTIILAACSQGPGIKKQDVGVVSGGALGALVGSQFGKGEGRIVGTAIGTLLGAGLGSKVGSYLDDQDMQYYNRVSQDTLETAKTGTTVSWRNPDTGVGGNITPTNTYSSNGLYCREYRQNIIVGGQSQQGFGTACRQPDGSWQIIQ